MLFCKENNFSVFLPTLKLLLSWSNFSAYCLKCDWCFTHTCNYTELLFEVHCASMWHCCSSLCTLAIRYEFSMYKSLTSISVLANRSNCSLHNFACCSNLSWLFFSKYWSSAFSPLCWCHKSGNICNDKLIIHTLYFECSCIKM